MLAITTDSFEGYGLDRAFAIASEAGLEGIEVSIKHEDFDTQDAEYLKSLSSRYKLPIVALAAPENISPSRAENTVDLAIAVGASVVTVTPPNLFDFHYKKWIEEEMRTVRKKKGIHIALVNPPAQTILGILPKYSVSSTMELKSFPDIALDTSNASSKHEPLIDIYAALKPSIVHMYLANSRHDKEHLLLDDGNVPLESLLTRLARDTYKGVLTLKLSPKSLGVGRLDRVFESIKKCQDFVGKYYRVE